MANNEEFMTDQLAQIRERAAKATQGPWLKDAELDDTEVIYVPLASVSPDAVSVLFKADWATPEDVEFVAHAITDIPFLLDKLATIRAETLEECCKAVCGHCASGSKPALYTNKDLGIHDWIHGDPDKDTDEGCAAAAIRDAGRKGL